MRPTPKIPLTCQHCGKEFWIKFKFRDQKFCSLKCTSLHGWSLKDHRQTYSKPCDICGKPMETRLSRVKSGRGKYCSKECYWKGMALTQTGKKMSDSSRLKLSAKRRGKLNPGYIDGRVIDNESYRGEFTTLLREKALVRDNYTCQKCGTTQGLLIHHLDQDPTHNEVSNYITWCRSCHSTYHRLNEYTTGKRYTKHNE